MRFIRLFLTLALVSATGLTALAKGRGASDRVAVGNSITVAEGQEADDIACAFCSVIINGDVTGDVAVFWGSVTVAPGHTIAGDAALAGGDLNLGEGASLNGDAAIVGGVAHVAEGAVIRGDRAVIPPPLGTLILLSPLIFLALLVWLVVYLVRRSRYRFPMYPYGQNIPPR